MENIRKNNLAKTLKALRIGHGYSYQDLAEKFNLTASLIRAYENGSKIPSKRFLRRLENFYSLEPHFLIDLYREAVIQNYITYKSHAISWNQFINLSLFVTIIIFFSFQPLVTALALVLGLIISASIYLIQR